MTEYDRLKEFYSGKRVLLTGHTGFKGSWMSMLLNMLGAKVYGYSLVSNTEPALYDILGIDDLLDSVVGDIRDIDMLSAAYVNAKPQVVIHMAAQPIVRDSYKNPVYTYETNVMGTVNILECIRKHLGAVSFLNVTTDKVYENSDKSDHAFTEDEKLDGYDPYSNSKSCSELVTHSYKKSFFNTSKIKMSDGQIVPAISTVRAGNVIGGGDFANDRIIPDCFRATIKGESITVRNPYSIRPYQHVLESIRAYLIIAMEQAYNSSLEGSYNIGPDKEDCINTGTVAELFVKNWGENASWKSISEINAPHEAEFLMLDNSKVAETFGIKPKWNINRAIEETVEWYKVYNSGDDIREYTRNQIMEYFS